jgi:replicative DNA helicase Mcm
MSNGEPTPDLPDKILQNGIFKADKVRNQFSQLAVNGKTTMDIKFEDVLVVSTAIAKDLIKKPDVVLKWLQDAAMAQLQIEDLEYFTTLEKLTVRVYDLLTSIKLRDIGADTIDHFVMINGTIIRSSQSKVRVTEACFECRRCGTRQIVNQDDPTAFTIKKPGKCAAPDCGDSTSTGGQFEFVHEESKRVDEQDIYLQENPDELNPGTIPRTLRLILHKDNIDVAKPGDKVSAVGVLRPVMKRNKGGIVNCFETILDVNSIEILGKEPDSLADPADMIAIIALSQEADILEKLVDSIAPSIFGYKHIKEACLYLLCGGVPIEAPDLKIRGEINILLIGDPGTAKSQLLRSVTKLAPRGLFTSGKGTTGVGLTAAVTRDPITEGFQLEAGALVLADKGVCAIDEMDKMNESDRTTLHEALEQHTISIAKGGIVATLNCRTAVLAAANPILGRYNEYASIIENISFPITLLSRFDLIFLMRDIPEKERDAKLSRHILNIHSGGHCEPAIAPELLRKYIAHARTINPVMTSGATDKIFHFFMKMRTADKNSPLAMTARQLEALTRISSARARAYLRSEVLAEDAQAAINMTKNFMKEVGTDVATGLVDADILLSGKPKSLRDKGSAILAKILELEKQNGEAKVDTVIEDLEKDLSIPPADTKRIIEGMLREGSLFSPREGLVKKT